MVDSSELVEQFQARVTELWAECEQAVANADSICSQLVTGDLPEADGSLAYRNARIAKRTALRAYLSARIDLADLILKETPPRKFHS